MLKLDFLGRYDVADMLMLAASVVVVVTILIAIRIAKPLLGARRRKMLARKSAS
jgi:hypothetical protein